MFIFYHIGFELVKVIADVLCKISKQATENNYTELLQKNCEPGNQVVNNFNKPECFLQTRQRVVKYAYSIWQEQIYWKSTWLFLKSNI